MKILIVEDSSETRAHIKKVAEGLGHTVECVDTGEEAIPCLAECDMLIVDWEMPGINGIELVKRARKYGYPIPIIMVTVKNKWDNLEEAVTAGADAFVSKPFSTQELIVRIKTEEERIARRHHSFFRR